MFLYCDSQARDLGKLIGEASPIAEETTTTMVDTTTTHEITKYGIHSFTQITLAVDNELTYRQDSAPDWLNKSSRQLVICIYRQ